MVKFCAEGKELSTKSKYQSLLNFIIGFPYFLEGYFF